MQRDAVIARKKALCRSRLAGLRQRPDVGARRAGRWRLCGGWQSGGCWAVGVGRPFIPPVFDHCPHANAHQPPDHRNYWNRGCNMQIESMKALTRLRQPSISPLMAEVVVETRVNDGVLVPVECGRVAGSALGGTTSWRWRTCFVERRESRWESCRRSEQMRA